MHFLNIYISILSKTQFNLSLRSTLTRLTGVSWQNKKALGSDDELSNGGPWRGGKQTDKLTERGKEAVSLLESCEVKAVVF